MTVSRRKKRGAKAGSPISDLSSADVWMAHSMNYWLARISPLDIARSWKGLAECVKDASEPIVSAKWASGTMFREDFRVVVTASTTGDGFALHFIVSATSTSNGAEQP
jgi:hypothetical protein